VTSLDFKFMETKKLYFSYVGKHQFMSYVSCVGSDFDFFQVCFPEWIKRRRGGLYWFSRVLEGSDNMRWYQKVMRMYL
jgi:hypothetical protein